MTLTHHGHHIQGTTDKDEPETHPVENCAGPGECQPCTRDSEKAWYPEMIAERKAAEETPVEREDVKMGKLDVRNLMPSGKKRTGSSVNHPSHYNMYDGFEVMDLVEQMNFNKGNAVKYVSRAEFKGKEIEDLEKARWYLKKEIQRLKRLEKKKRPRRGGVITGPSIIDEIHNTVPGIGGTPFSDHMNMIQRVANRSAEKNYSRG